MNRRLDLAIAAAWLVALAVEVIALRHRHGALGLNLLAVAGLAVPAVCRRRAPVRFTAAVLVAATVYIAWLSGRHTNVAPLYVLTVPAYTLAAYRPRSVAIAGLLVCCAWASLVNALSGEAVGDYIGTAITVCVPWALGRALHARRRLNAELEQRARRIEAERESRARLAVADERTRIARELHTVVAAGVSAMVVQAEAALLLLDADPARADAAMAAVEATGRHALTEMRRLLGVLRHGDEAVALAPLPGVGQVHALVERARGPQRRIELAVTGEPGPLPASVDLSLYRILEEALAAGDGFVEVELRFGTQDIALTVTAPTGTDAWPTLAMLERAAVCDGTVECRGGWLVARLPRGFEQVFA